MILADFLYGPFWAASLVTIVVAFAPRRMNLALLAALVAAAMFVTGASIRSSNRHYHINHPDLNLEMSTPVLVVWTTIIAGVTAAGWYFLRWAQLLVGSAGWTSHRLPRVLSLFYLLGGAVSLFVYLVPANEGFVVMLGVVVSTWLVFLLWTARSGDTQEPESYSAG